MSEDADANNGAIFTHHPSMSLVRGGLQASRTLPRKKHELSDSAIFGSDNNHVANVTAALGASVLRAPERMHENANIDTSSKSVMLKHTIRRQKQAQPVT